jgi:hypothetical protein
LDQLDADSENYDDDLSAVRKRSKKKSQRPAKGPSMSERGLIKLDSIEMTDQVLLEKNGSNQEISQR